jgi:hypothetical protein
MGKWPPATTALNRVFTYLARLFRAPSGTRRLVRIPAAAAAAAFVVIAAALASAALSGGDSGTARAGCGTGTWANTATGKPAALSSDDGRSFYVWRDARSWHLRALGATRSAPLSGQIQADARLRVVAASPAIRSGLRSQRRSVNFRLSSAGPAGLDFRIPCAARLSFRLNGSSASRIHLGSSGRVPAPTFRLTRPAATGVAGRILLGSNCPVVGNGCPALKPTDGTVRIETAPVEKGTSSRVVARVGSDADGNYSADITQGRYLLVVEKRGYPAQKAHAATVEAGIVTLTDLILDSGIR